MTISRRSFMAAIPTATVSLATLKAPLFVPVSIWKDVPAGTGWTGGDVDYRECGMCYEKAYEDWWAGKPERQYFQTTDEYDYCVCEHCIGDYLAAEEAC